MKYIKLFESFKLNESYFDSSESLIIYGSREGDELPYQTSYKCKVITPSDENFSYFLENALKNESKHGIPRKYLEGLGGNNESKLLLLQNNHNSGILLGKFSDVIHGKFDGFIPGNLLSSFGLDSLSDANHGSIGFIDETEIDNFIKNSSFGNNLKVILKKCGYLIIDSKTTDAGKGVRLGRKS
jgi:hypothetical protein